MGLFMPQRFGLLAPDFLYKTLSTSVQHKEETETALQQLTQNPAMTIKTQNYNNII